MLKYRTYVPLKDKAIIGVCVLWMVGAIITTFLGIMGIVHVSSEGWIALEIFTIFVLFILGSV